MGLDEELARLREENAKKGIFDILNERRRLEERLRIPRRTHHVLPGVMLLHALLDRIEKLEQR